MSARAASARPAGPPARARTAARVCSPSSASCASMGHPRPRPWRWWKVQPVSPRIVELFNDALTFELTVTNTYFLHARMLENWGLGKLGKVFYELSIEEMEDADDIINRGRVFDGHPNVQKLNAITVGETAEEMLRLALE